MKKKFPTFPQVLNLGCDFPLSIMAQIIKNYPHLFVEMLNPYFSAFFTNTLLLQLFEESIWYQLASV
jgi:hypothetical protein